MSMDLLDNISIRPVRLSDADKLLAIYSYYVEETAITFEYDVPSLEEFEERIRSISSCYPYLVAESDGQILGYAYAHAFHERAAFQWCVEMTIYLDRACRGRGIGPFLYQELESQLKAQGYLNLYASIAIPEVEDEYLTHNSEEFHRHLGYKTIGTFRNSGYKFDTWYHMIWMEKIIGAHNSSATLPGGRTWTR